MKALLLTWSDRGAAAARLAHHTSRSSSDQGPVLRLLRQPGYAERYESALVFTNAEGKSLAEKLCQEMAPFVPAVELVVLDAPDPSDHGRLFAELGPVVERINRRHPPGRCERDVILSAGTPQMQTLWVILVQAGLLPARMLQVIPAEFVPKPHPEAVREVRFDFEGFPEIRALRDEVARLRAAARLTTRGIIGHSEAIEALLARTARVAAADMPVLVFGETGTGKELVARAIHESSTRARGPFIAESCAAFTDGLLASELFGHEPGAFTGAAGRRRGLFEQAHGGTLFLDEVGELEPRVQALLLRTLQEGTLRRLGGEVTVAVDVRVVAATHRPLAEMVRAGSFREDLYYRLRGATLEVPPLRQRSEDIPALVEHFLDSADQRLRLSSAALEALQRYSWPGNVRELRAEVLRWTVFCDQRVELADLSPELRSEESSLPNREARAEHRSQATPLQQVIADAERRAIACALERHSANLSQTARDLSIDRNTLKRKLKLYGLRPMKEE